MNSVTLIAHRGASGIVGEDNTLRACQHAIAMGCDMIEIDVRLTADGQMICFHDGSVDGDPVSSLSLNEIQERWAVPIPTLADCVALCAGKIDLDVEIKQAGYEAAVLSVLSQHPIDEHVVIKSFHKHILKTLRSLQCPYPLGYLLDACPADTDRKRYLAQHSPQSLDFSIDFIGPHFSLIDDEFFEYFSDVPCFPWTINNPSDMRHLLQFPIHGLITDRPDYAQMLMRSDMRSLNQEEIKLALETDQDDQLIARLQHRCMDADARIDVRAVHFCHDLQTELANWIDAAWGATAQVCIVHDAELDMPVIEALRKAYKHVYTLHKQAPFDHLTPHDHFANELSNYCKDLDGIIAIGSGTVNDICKFAAAQNKQEYLCCATAASMNGYTSSIAALLIDNLKSTVLCSPPIAVLVESSIIKEAPLALAQSGFADLLSKYVSLSDWKLANLVRDDDFNDVPGRIANNAIERIKSLAHGIPTHDAQASQVLMQAIILSGFSMSLAGSSAPASGGEHLISHYLDMGAYQAQRCPALHGEQVALGTLLSSRLYELLRQADPSTFQPHSYTSEALATIHGPLWPIIQKTAEAQFISQAEATQRIQHIQKQWNHIWQELDHYLTAHADIVQALQAAGVACHPSAYGISDALMRRAFLHAADIRNRYTVLHFARDCGMLEQLADEVLSTAFHR